MNEIILRRLLIKTFHIMEIRWGKKCKIQDHILELNQSILDEIRQNEPLIKDIKIQIIQPGEYDREINTIMDIVPISTKVLGKIGEGITHTLTGTLLMLTGADEEGNQMHEFGSSNGNMREKIIFNRAGTPKSTDIIIHLDVILEKGHEFDRKLPNAIFKASDLFLNEIREVLKIKDGRESDETYEFYDKIRPNAKKVILLKQIAGQGAMYDNLILPNEPSGFIGGRSIIDLGNVPIVLSPNEYRDGALRSME